MRHEKTGHFFSFCGLFGSIEFLGTKCTFRSQTLNIYIKLYVTHINKFWGCQGGGGGWHGIRTVFDCSLLLLNFPLRVTNVHLLKLHDQASSYFTSRILKKLRNPLLVLVMVMQPCLFECLGQTMMTLTENKQSQLSGNTHLEERSVLMLSCSFLAA